jgi:predicted DNA-binding WGR domain protein
MCYTQSMDWQHCPPELGTLRFERHDPAQNAHRYYVLSWRTTLFGTMAVVREFGRQGRSQRRLVTEFPSLPAAWPFIRAVIRARLRHHYRLCGGRYIP